MAEQRDSGSSRRVPSHPLARGSVSAGRSSAGKGGGRRGGGRPLPPGEQFFTPGATGLRAAVERRSAAPLVFLYQLPRWIVPVVMVVLLLAGLAVPDWRGGLATLPVAAFVAWLSYLSWPSLGVRGKLLRAALLTFLVLVAADRFGAF